MEYSTDPPFYAGATANLSCDVDYEPLENHTMATCYDVGQWVPHVLQCERKHAVGLVRTGEGLGEQWVQGE